MTVTDNAPIGLARAIHTRSEKRSDMDGEQNGTQAQQVEGQQQEAQQQAHEQQEAQAAQGKHAKGAEANTGSASCAGAEVYEKQLAERDFWIAELEGQIAEAAKSAEAADGLRAEIAALKQQSEDERVEFSLLLAGCRNVKAAKAVSKTTAATWTH